MILAMQILITGGAGFIGTNIALLAIEKGNKVAILDSFVRGGVRENARMLKKLGATIIEGDVSMASDLKKIKKRPDFIIHLAANSSIPWSIKNPLTDFQVNVIGTLHILEFARKNGKIPVIFASTNKVYSEEINLIPIKREKTRYVWDFSSLGKNRIRRAVLDGIGKRGVNEKFPMDSSGVFSHSPYGVSKAASDLYCQEYYHIYGLPTVINRMSCVFGLHQKGVEDQGWIDWFFRAKAKNLSLNIYGSGKQIRDALFASDLAKLVLLQIKNITKIKGMVFNIGGGADNTISPVELIDFLNKKQGKSLKLLFRDPRPSDQRIYISDISKVKNVLGWQPIISVKEGLEAMWKSYKT